MFRHYSSIRFHYFVNLIIMMTTTCFQKLDLVNTPSLDEPVSRRVFRIKKLEEYYRRCMVKPSSAFMTFQTEDIAIRLCYEDEVPKNKQPETEIQLEPIKKEVPIETASESEQLRNRKNKKKYNNRKIRNYVNTPKKTYRQVTAKKVYNHKSTTNTKETSTKNCERNQQKKECLLPTERGDSDLNVISHKTLSRLLQNDFKNDVIHSLVDCRFPYEHSRGHIKTSHNIYTKEEMLKFSKSGKTNKPQIIVLYCNTSLSQTRTLLRHLQNCDVTQELYILFGGYNKFCDIYESLCYKPEVQKQNLTTLVKNFRTLRI